jgi:hypothetical protein
MVSIIIAGMRKYANVFFERDDGGRWEGTLGRRGGTLGLCPSNAVNLRITAPKEGPLED